MHPFIEVSAEEHQQVLLHYFLHLLVQALLPEPDCQVLGLIREVGHKLFEVVAMGKTLQLGEDDLQMLLELLAH